MIKMLNSISEIIESKGTCTYNTELAKVVGVEASICYTLLSNQYNNTCFNDCNITIDAVKETTSLNDNQIIRAIDKLAYCELIEVKSKDKKTFYYVVNSKEYIEQHYHEIPLLKNTIDYSKLDEACIIGHTTTDIATMLGIDQKELNKSVKIEIGKNLRFLGYELMIKKINKKTCKVWYKK